MTFRPQHGTLESVIRVCAVLLSLAVLAAALPLLGCRYPARLAARSDTSGGLVSDARPLMGTQFLIQVASTDRDRAHSAIDAAYAEVSRSEEILSNWSATSQISRVNQAAGRAPLTISTDLFRVLERALAVASLTNGAFDPTFAACGHLWSVRQRRIPTEDEIAGCLPLVDYRRVALDPETSAVLLPDTQMQLGLAGLAKGYRIDRAAEVLQRHGFSDFLIDGGGDIRVSTASLPPWKITIADPRQEGHILGAVDLASGAIATSGDYQWYFEQDGVRYHHIIDPSTGRPARRSIAATVIAPTAVEADALATGLFVMGPDDGLALAEKLSSVEAMLIAPDLSHHHSSRFPPIVTPGGPFG